jgi:hypothetical protein
VLNVDNLYKTVDYTNISVDKLDETVDKASKSVDKEIQI